jgi:putative MATE family efflux protein
MKLRSPYDAEIARLAFPALGALAAEPLYILVDTAIVGHLGRAPLAALASAATALGVLAMFNFLQYGTTAQVARAAGAGEHQTARRLGAQALWLSLTVGCVLAVLFAIFARPIVELIGVDGETADLAATYLRIVAIGIPSVFVALGGQGFLRGVSSMRAALVVLVAANVLNLVLEVWLVYGLDLGIKGSAWGTAVAQTAMGLAFVCLILRRIPTRDRSFVAPLARRLLSIGKFLFVRTFALIAAFLLAGTVVARLGDAELAAYQISFQLLLFIALVLDAIAIAGQIIVARELGAARPERAYQASMRMITISVVTGAAFAVMLVALAGPLPRVFSSDAEVLAQCALLWPLLALVQPVGGAVFALDGILIGAGDGPFLAASMVIALGACGLLLGLGVWLDLGIRGVWGALVGLMLVRLVTMGARFRRRRWLVTGWA